MWWWTLESPPSWCANRGAKSISEGSLLLHKNHHSNLERCPQIQKITQDLVYMILQCLIFNAPTVTAFASICFSIETSPFLELTSQGKCFYLHPNFNPYLMGGERNKDLQQLERGRNEWANSIRWKGHRARPKGRNIAPPGFTATLESSRTLIRDCSEAQVRCSGNCPERERGVLANPV